MGKWSMRICAVLFLLIALAALAVVFIPALNEWIADNSVEAVDTNPGGLTSNYVPTGGIVTPGDVTSTAWILVATFLPMAALFWWIGSWFKSMQPSFDSRMQTSAQMTRNSSAMFGQQFPQGTVVPDSGVITSGSPVPSAPAPPATAVGGDLVVEPPDPTAGGIIS